MTYEQLGGDATGNQIGEVLFADYAEAGQAPNAGMGVWFWRTSYDCSQGLPVQQSIDKHRAEWRLALGLDAPPVEPIEPIGQEAEIAREYAGNMCGIRAFVQPVPGGARDASVVLSWFYDRYSPADREVIRNNWKIRGQKDVLLSWPDSRAYGYSADQFVATCRELVSYGFRPCVFLLSKDHDPHNDVSGCLANVNQVLDKLVQFPRAASRICIGWELCIDRWLQPEELDQLTDNIAPRCVAAGVPCYVHFQQGYAHMDHDPGGTFGKYWIRQKGKLHGLLHQRKQTGTVADPPWSKEEYQARLVDILDRFSGRIDSSGIDVSDSGFGHPFDCIALEITAMDQFNGAMSEADGDSWGRVALAAPPVDGVRVMGSGNGQ